MNTRKVLPVGNKHKLQFIRNVFAINISLIRISKIIPLLANKLLFPYYECENRYNIDLAVWIYLMII